MKKLTFLAAALLLPALASAQSTLNLRGVEYKVDTVYHAKIGPGTTQTSLRLSGPNPLTVFYLTIDRTAPGVSLRAVCATDKVAGNECVSAMAARKTQGNNDYFCGVNGDFYATSGTSTNGKSVVGTPTTSCIVDGEIFKSSASQYQFYVDTEGNPGIGRFNYYTGTATLGDKVTLFKGVNVSSPSNGITLYTDRYYGSANQTSYAGACKQVTAKLVDGDAFKAGGKYRMQVTSTPTDDGDLAVPDGGFVIHARGNSTGGCNTGSTDFVGALKPGDIVSFDNIILCNDKAIQPYSVVSGNPRNVGGGETLDTEGERGDASARHPRTNIGFSQDGSKIIMMVIDGRSGISAGVTTSMSADILRYAGAWEAMNLDGGGSSTLYVEKLGVRNNPSDGRERAVGNAIFAVLDAPEDNEVASIGFCDWRKRMGNLSTYEPVVYAYNKYGKLIDTNYKKFTLSFEGGTVSDDGRSVTATRNGCFALVATAGQATASIPVTVTSDAIYEPKYADVVLDTHREWKVQVNSIADGLINNVDPAMLKWTSSDTDIATIGEDGTVRGISAGKCTLVGTVGENEVVVNLSIEIPAAERVPLAAYRAGGENPWTATGSSSVKNVNLTPTASGFDVDYNVSSTRGAKLTVQINKEVASTRLHSLPEAIRVVVNPGTSKVSATEVTLLPANSPRNISLSRKVALTADTDNELTFPVSEFFDTTDIGIYPLNFTSIAFTPSGTKEASLNVKSVEAVYDPASLGVTDITVDNTDSDAPAQWYDLQGRPAGANPAPGIYVSDTHHKKVVK